MADHTQIEWTDATWNPITGCSLASPGCTNCYAMKLAGTRMKHHWSRKGLTQDAKSGPVWTGEIRFNEEWLTQPLQWKRPRMVFVCAHGDLFHESVPDEWIDRVFAVMALAPQHTFQVLTKRSARMREYLGNEDRGTAISIALGNMLDGDWIWKAGRPLRPAIEKLILAFGAMPQCEDDDFEDADEFGYLPDPMPLPNVWLGVSVEDQARADERIPDLLATPAAVRWLSCEPLLEEVLFDPCDLARIDWLVVGGENGPRPMHPDWARSLRDQCAVAAGVPFFFKQWGSWAPVCEMSEEAIDSAYHPAPVNQPEATRRAKVDQCVLHRDGRRFDGRAMFERPAFEQGSGAMTMFRIGKKAAGRLLDGVQHDAFPASPVQAGAPQ